MARAKKEAVSTETADETPVIEATEEPKVEVVAEAALESSQNGTKSADEGIAELKKRLEAVERERNEAVQRAYRANTEKDESDRLFIESQAAQAKANADYLENAYANAVAQGDHLSAAKIARQMAQAEAQILQLQNGAQQLKEKPKDQPRPLDPVEALATQLSPRSAAWVRAHPEYATNPRLTQKMIAAHNLAMADGIPVDSDDYFASVEETLKVAQRAPTRAIQDDDGEDQFSGAGRATSGRQAAPAAIPVSRDISPTGSKPRTVRLSPAEVEAAEMSGLTPAEYYANKMALEDDRRNGRLN